MSVEEFIEEIDCRLKHMTNVIENNQKKLIESIDKNVHKLIKTLDMVGNDINRLREPIWKIANESDGAIVIANELAKIKDIMSEYFDTINRG